jgi:hypothetical protein
MAAVEAERVLKRVETLAGRLVTGIVHPAEGLE